MNEMNRVKMNAYQFRIHGQVEPFSLENSIDLFYFHGPVVSSIVHPRNPQLLTGSMVAVWASFQLVCVRDDPFCIEPISVFPLVGGSPSFPNTPI